MHSQRDLDAALPWLTAASEPTRILRLCVVHADVGPTSDSAPESCVAECCPPGSDASCCAPAADSAAAPATHAAPAPAAPPAPTTPKAAAAPRAPVHLFPLESRFSGGGGGCCGPSSSSFGSSCCAPMSALPAAPVRGRPEAHGTASGSSAAAEKIREAASRSRPGQDLVSCCAGGACGAGAAVTAGDEDTNGAPRVPPAKVSNPRASEYTYEGEALRAVALNFGPIGGGCVSLAGDGGLRQWQVSNVVNHTGQVPDSFFAIRCTTAAAADGSAAPTDTAAVLMCDSLYDSTGFTPAPMISDADVPDSSIALLKALPGIPDLSIQAKFPIAEVTYTPPAAMPLQVSTEVMSPFIPLDSKNSGMPIVFFNITLKNTGTVPATATLLQTQQNIGGWDGESAIVDEVCNAGFGGNVNNAFSMSGVTALDMSNSALRAADEFNGHVAIGVIDPGAGPTAAATAAAPSPLTVATMPQQDSAAAIWSAFTSSGGIGGKGKTGPSPSGKSWVGSVSAATTLAPGESRTVTFFLAWHFPNRCVEWSQAGFGIKDKYNKFIVGQGYANTWPTITAVVEAARDNCAALCASTRLFRDTFYTSSLPWQVLDSAAPRATVLRSPTCMWHGDGNFYAFEGCSSTGGCCPLNCTHVWDYEMALSRVFPDLERTMRNVDLTVQIAPNAIVPSRTTVPLDLRRQWNEWPDNYTGIDPASTAICTDGEICTVLKTYREVLQGAPAAWFKAMWPQAQKILERWYTDLDAKADGLIWGPQPSTYDCALYGPNTFMSGLYAAALRAGAAMATMQGDAASAAKYTARAEVSAKSMDAQLFTNGKWYTQVTDPKNPVNELADAAFVDQLLGQWWAHAMGLGYIVSVPANVGTAVKNVMAANHRTSFDPSKQAPRRFYDERDAGCYLGTWPDGPAPAKPMLYTSEGAWSGVMYPMAGLAMMEGQTDVWTTILGDIRARQDGTRRSPWNEIECGDWYSRPMAGWLLVETASGQLYNSVAQSLAFAPRVGAANAFQSFYITGGSWGSFAQKGSDPTMATGTATITVAYGSLALASLALKSAATTATAAVGATPEAATATAAGGTLTLTFKTAITVTAGQTLTITLGPGGAGASGAASGAGASE